MKRASALFDSQETTKKFKSLNEQENSEDDCDAWGGPRSPIRGEIDYTYPKRDFTEELKRQTVEAAELALEFYNKKYRKNYQLVDALASNAMLCNGIWVHCNFTAKEQRTSDGDEDSPTKLFFAELRGIKGPPYNSVTHCRILKVNLLDVRHAKPLSIHPMDFFLNVSFVSALYVLARVVLAEFCSLNNCCLGLTKSVAAELGLHGIRVNCVSPYAIPTNLSVAHLPEDERTEDVFAGVRAFSAKNANLKGVELTVDDVANCVPFLASDEAKYVSGDNLVVDGGFTVVNHSLKVFR